MADPTSPASAPADKGPYSNRRVTTFEISGPIKITTTTTEDASHVPKPCGCGGGNGMSLGMLYQLLTQLAAQMGASTSGPTPEGAPSDGESSAH